MSAAVHGSHSAQQQQYARWYLEVVKVVVRSPDDDDDDNNNNNNEPPKRTRIYYYDTRNFGTLRFSLNRVELADKLQSLGPDILEPTTCTAAVFCQIVAATKKPSMNICRFLMDQSKISGVGNYMLAEGLYRARIDPFCALEDLSTDDQVRLFEELQKVAVESYQSQGMTRTAVGQYRTMDGQQGQYAFSLQCYGQQVAKNGEKVYKQVNGPHNRTIWYTKEQLLSPSRRTQDTSMPQEPVMDPTMTNVPQQQQSFKRIKRGDPVVDPVEELMSQLTEPSWKEALSTVESSEWFIELAKFVAEERQTHQIYPPPHQVFAALNLCPLDQVKVIIVGQDPYHGYGQGHGLAFSVQKGVKPPPSLVNIFKEAHADVGIPYPPPHGNLEQWARQGVLLLNSVLTVRRGKANSHAGQGWETFTDTIVEILNERRDGLIFLLWGQPAQRKASAVDESRHLVIRTSHPSPLGATKTNAPFLGSRCFSRTNRFLEQTDRTAIDWRVL